MIVMDIINFENLIKSNFLKEKIEVLLKSEGGNEKKYLALVTLLEYINLKLLKEHLNVEMPDSNIVRIIAKYGKLDEKLYNLMLGINDQYNEVNLNDVKDDDVEDLLYDIDFMYGYILEKYGNILEHP